MKLYYIILFLTFIISHNSYSSEKRFKVHTLAFYNLENLFDTINDTSKRDEASPIMEMKRLNNRQVILAVIIGYVPLFIVFNYFMGLEVMNAGVETYILDIICFFLGLIAYLSSSKQSN